MLPAVLFDGLTMLSSDEECWLVILRNELISDHVTTGSISINVETAKRVIDIDEIKFLIDMVQAKKLFCCFGTGNFGFGLTVSFYKHLSIEAKQGNKEPVCAITIHADHFWVTGTPNNPKARKDAIWSAFSPIFNSKPNIEMLTFHGFELPKPRQHYSY